MNSNWSRWLRASVMKHIDDNRDSMPIFIEGQERKKEQSDYFEIRFNGPIADQVSKNEWRLFIEVSILITSAKHTTDLYKIDRHVGKAMSLLPNNIEAFKFGDGNGTLGCLTRDSNVETIHFGQLDPSIQVLEASVEALYQIQLRT